MGISGMGSYRYTARMTELRGIIADVSTSTCIYVRERLFRFVDPGRLSMITHYSWPD
jgi:hypothetical protein